MKSLNKRNPSEHQQRERERERKAEALFIDQIKAETRRGE